MVLIDIEIMRAEREAHLLSLLERTLVAVEGWSYLLTSDMDCPLAREIKEALQ